MKQCLNREHRAVQVPPKQEVIPDSQLEKVAKLIHRLSARGGWDSEGVGEPPKVIDHLIHVNVGVLQSISRSGAGRHKVDRMLRGRINERMHHPAQMIHAPREPVPLG